MNDTPVLHRHPRFPLATNEEAWQFLPEAATGKGQPLPNWARALAPKLPHTAAAVLELDHLYRTTLQFSQRERGLVRWAAATINRSGYGRAYAAADLKASGCSEAQLAQFAEGSFESLNDRERLIVDFVSQLSKAGRDVTDQQIRDVQTAFDEDRLVGLVLLTGYANFQDRLVHALAVPVEESGPLAPLAVTFATSPGGSLTPRADRPPLPDVEGSKQVERPEWSDFTFEMLQSRLEKQRERSPRLRIPDWEEVRSRLATGLYNPNQPLRIRWSQLVVFRQPELGPAWIKCLRVFGNEAAQSRTFEESVFWVVTRELRCFYCMGHCEMLLEVGGLNPRQIAERTHLMAEGDWSEFAPSEQATFALASQMTRAPWAVSDQDVDRVKTALGPDRALDAVWWISRCQFMTKVSDAFQLQLERDNVFMDFEPPKEQPRSGLCATDSDITDWRRNYKLLLESSEPLVRALFAENKANGDVVAAVGYVFEFGRGQLCFEICANTARKAETSLAEHLAMWPSHSVDELRWNSGDYDYPGAVQDRFGGFSTEWWEECKRLDRLVADDKSLSESVHIGIANICCEVLAELARRGVFVDWSNIDFNVAALLDEIEQVKQRDQYIRNLIRSTD